MLRILFVCNLIIFNNLSYSQENYENSVFLIQFCNNDTCKPLATGFLVYDDTLGTDQFYLVTNEHVVKKGNKYLNQIVFSKIDSNAKFINYSYSFINDSSFKSSYYINYNKDLLWRTDNSFGQDIIIMKLLKDCELIKDYTPINLTESADYIEINKNDTLTTFGFPVKEWSISKNTGLQEIEEFYKLGLQRIKVKLDSIGKKTQSLMNLKSRILYEKNPIIKDSLNIVISDSSRILKNKLSSYRNEIDYFKKASDDFYNFYYRDFYRPLQYNGYFNSILDSLTVKINETNIMFRDIISSTVFANFGQSGSPIFLLREDKHYLIGIIFAMDGGHNSFAVPNELPRRKRTGYLTKC